tara:strand:- start:708 stop:1124 length:417 start_codon:yes stop_codon:yes gene_type:complete
MSNRGQETQDSKNSESDFRFSKAYPSEYLREPDLMGRETTLTIKGWRYTDASDKGSDGKQMGDGVVVSFIERPKELVLALINYKSIRRIHGSDPNNWIGKRVTFFPTTCHAFGDPKHPCIRVRSRVVDPNTGKPADLF